LSDARWIEVFDDARDAVTHYSNGGRLFEAGGFTGDELNAYQARMAFMHAIQSGHTSLEASLLRILDILAEERPGGDQWHRDLISRASKATAGENLRPAILPPKLAAFADETRRFRNLAMRSYGSFDAGKAAATAEAARQLADGLLDAITRFRDAVDPAK
jgi:hypothetical protein